MKTKNSGSQWVLFMTLLGGLALAPAQSYGDLLSYWDFEGDFVDSIGSNDGSLIPDGAQVNNATTGSDTERSGEVLILDGLGDGLVTPANASLDFTNGDSFTYAFWVKAQVNNQVGNNNDRSTFVMRDLGANPYNGVSIIGNATASSGGPFFRGALDGGATGVLAQTTDQTEVDAVLDDQWHHIAWVVKNVGSAAGSSTMYFDGSVLAQSIDLSAISGGDISAGSVPLYIGAERATGTRWLWGRMDDLAVWSNALPDSSVEGLADGTYSPTTAPLGGPLQVIVDRSTGNVKLSNDTGQGIDILGYMLTSDSGALDQVNWTTITGHYDALPGNGGTTGDGSVDMDDNWTILSAEGDTTDLSEAEFDGGDGGTIADEQVVDFGNVWIQNLVEDGDMTMTLLLANGDLEPVAIVFEGGNGAPYERSDLDFDNDIDLQDWFIYTDGLDADLSGLSGPQAYQKGDLNGDGLNNDVDLVIFRNDYDQANGAGAFAAMLASVPEPSSVVLCMIAGLGLLYSSRRRS